MEACLPETATAGRPMIEIDNVTRAYGDFLALDRANLTIREGEFFSLLGPSGCGKTTLLRMIAGFDNPTSGTISIDGQPMAGIAPNARPTNMVFQSYAIFPHLKVGENVAYGLKKMRLGAVEEKRRVDEALAMVSLAGLQNRGATELSGGQRQRVALARALVMRPKVLLLDEPLSALDYKLRKDMQIELKRLQAATGITFIFVTHDQEEALTMSDRIAVMSSGKILQIGSPWDIYDKPAVRFVADFIGETNFLTATVVTTKSGQAKVRLPSGVTIQASVAEGFAPLGDVTVVIRPEHAKAVKAKAELSGTVENIVYFGTDTNIHVKLDTGELFTVRQQNSRSADCGFAIGDPVGIAVADDAAQVLRD